MIVFIYPRGSSGGIGKGVDGKCPSLPPLHKENVLFQMTEFQFVTKERSGVDFLSGVGATD